MGVKNLGCIFLKLLMVTKKQVRIQIRIACNQQPELNVSLFFFLSFIGAVFILVPWETVGLFFLTPVLRGQISYWSFRISLYSSNIWELQRRGAVKTVIIKENIAFVPKITFSSRNFASVSFHQLYNAG